MPETKEQRLLETNISELRIDKSSEGGDRIVGYTAVFDQEIEFKGMFGGGFREVIRKGAFTRAIEENHDIRALFNHDPNNILGRTTSNTLFVREDDVGLFVDIRPDLEDSHSANIMRKIERGDVTGMSFQFTITKETWTEEEEGLDLREIQDVNMFDVGPVTFPAYDETTAAVRSIEQIIHGRQNIGQNKSQIFVPEALNVDFGRSPDIQVPIVPLPLLSIDLRETKEITEVTEPEEDNSSEELLKARNKRKREKEILKRRIIQKKFAK